MEFIKAQIILDYKHFYDQDPPADRLSLISHLSKNDILAEIVALNYRLKPNNSHYIDTSKETQIKELRYFSQLPDYFLNNLRIFRLNSGGSAIRSDYPLVFTRQTCLYAIEEIINSDRLVDIPNLGMPDIHAWESLFKYILCVNSELDIKTDDDHSIENINAKALVLNELGVDTDLALTVYKANLLMNFFYANEYYKQALIDYFLNYYGFNFKTFLKKIIQIYFGNSGEYKFFYYIEEDDAKFFDTLSIRYTNDDYRKLISIKKSPFFKANTEQYLITDLSLLVEKSYYQFVNDFWFDFLKGVQNNEGKKIYNISSYRGVVGYFFESYIGEIIRRAFSKDKYTKILLFDELKIITKKSSIELVDVYIRNGNKIILGEVKSGSIYDNEKYGGDVTALYKGNRDKFFENFGVNQLVESIINLEKYIVLLDPNCPIIPRCIIYPCIILNDKVFQTPLMADIFNSRFSELISGAHLEKISIKALTIIQVNDLERIEEHLYSAPKDIWWILRKHTRNFKYMTPFSTTLALLNIPYVLPKKVFSTIRHLLREKNNF